ncbi:gliding motility-associated C-terminal domain-containing protein [Pontibacter lucknowensis]|uniref:Gliding motility-associated C-terminal domain-containing protein n=1 Tax=Pontibacter lucknowensis TaxID=1077936 RepID=A0A1N7AQH1_9BACT|nr:gliding motility-associated C-terminal domain-containing protein [Pontibacter lucknowensis]SIR41251.1 gliding motility-associated C-terminal domain-containing protein [Pontibacter lucknowensis]
MNKPLLLLLFWFFSLNLQAQIQWGHQVGSTGMNAIENHIVDKDGNIISVGHFEGTITIGNHTLTSLENIDMFMYKSNPAGQVLWAKTLGGPQNGGAIGVATDKYGNIYVGGVFIEELLIDDKVVLKGEGVFNTFIGKFDTNGKLLWSKGVLTRERYASATLMGVITASPEGEVVLPVQFWGTVQLENQQFKSQNPRGNDLLLIKLSSEGQVSFVSRSFHDGSVYPREVKLDAVGNVYMTGAYIGTYKIANHSIATGPESHDDIFVAKFDKQGRTLWLKGFNNAVGLLSSAGESLEIDPKTKNIYLAGYFKGRIDFDGIVLEETGMVEFPGVPADIFLASLTENGAVIWARSYAGEGHDLAKDLKLLPSGGLMLAGAWDFKPFVQYFDAAGNPGERISLSAGGVAENITLAANGSFYISGQFWGPLQAEHLSWKAKGEINGFLMKFDPCSAKSAQAGSAYKTYNVITPNGDGKNEYFVLDPALAGAKLQVYSRWGSKVYESSNYNNDWSGNGLPEAVYHWVVTHDCSGTLKGTVTIIR